MAEDHESAARNREPPPFFIAGSGESAAGLISRLFSVQLGILLPFFSERSLEVRHSAWDRDHACAEAQKCDRAAGGGARRASREEREPIPPLFVALPALRAPALLTPRKARGCAIFALRATSDHFCFQSGVWLSQRSTGP